MRDPKSYEKALRAAQSVVYGTRRNLGAVAAGAAILMTSSGCGDNVARSSIADTQVVVEDTQQSLNDIIDDIIYAADGLTPSVDTTAIADSGAAEDANQSSDATSTEDVVTVADTAGQLAGDTVVVDAGQPEEDAAAVVDAGEPANDGAVVVDAGQPDDDAGSTAGDAVDVATADVMPAADIEGTDTEEELSCLQPTGISCEEFKDCTKPNGNTCSEAEPCLLATNLDCSEMKPCPDADVFICLDGKCQNTKFAECKQGECHNPNNGTICEAGECMDQDFSSEEAMKCCADLYAQGKFGAKGCNPWGPPAPPSFDGTSLRELLQMVA